MRRVTLVPVCALLAVACQDAPTQPTVDEAAPPPSATFAASVAADQPSPALAVTAALDDATTRLVGGLEDRGVARQLGIHLETLSARLAAGDRAGAERALNLARGVLSRQSDRLGEEADTGSIQLALDSADALLHGAAAEEQE